MKENNPQAGVPRGKTHTMTRHRVKKLPPRDDSMSWTEFQRRVREYRLLPSFHQTSVWHK